MRKTKRDMSARAFKLGYMQGIRGHAKEGCPFHEATKRGEWMGGWRVGHAYYVSGYIAQNFI